MFLLHGILANGCNLQSVSVDVPQVTVDVNGKHKKAATPGPAPSPSVWTKPGVDVTVGGRRLQDHAGEHATCCSCWSMLFAGNCQLLP